MSDEQEEYIAVLKASYDYSPQSDDEIPIKEDQLLLLIEKTDDDWWKVKAKGNSDGHGGLIPSAYVESAEHSSVVKVQYDYDAAAQGELSVKEDQMLLVFGTEEDGWLLVQDKDGGKVGYVPGNYVEPVDDSVDDAGTIAAAPSAASHIVIPDSPSKPARPVSTYVDPAELVRSTASKVKMDAIKTWAISEIDKKGKKKKGTLGIGNGAIFFASEADKTPVQKWQIGDIISADIDKSKHILIEVGGAAAASLHFHAGNKDTAEEILVKFESSRSLARQSPELAAAPQAETEHQAEQEFEPTPAPTQRALPPPLRTDGTHSPSKKGVHFSEASPAIIPPRPASPPEQEAAQHEEVEGLEAVALYDFQAQGDDELTVAEGDALWIIEKDGDEWWKCRNVKGDEGVVPASYIEPTGPGRLPSRPEEPEEEDEDDGGAADREAEERAAAERAEQKEKEELEHKERQAKEQRAKAAAVAAEAERKRKEKEKREREREERELEERVRREKEKEHEEEEDAEAEEEARRLAAERKASKAAAKAARSSKSTSEGRKSLEKRAPPDSSQTREWRDRTGQFRVEAAFLGYKNGVLRLHKINGVVIEVPSEKMSIEDIRHVEKLMGRGGSSSRKPDDDDEPLAKRRQSLQSAPVAAAPPKKAPPIDWFEFFLNAGCDVDDCTRYASSFDRDKIDESILPDITESTLRTLGLREGDIIRVTKAIDGRRPKPPAKPAPSEVSLLGGDDALASVPAPARATPSPGPPNLFTNPGGQLKNARRGRPTPNKTGSTAPGSVELGAISTASEQIARSTTPLMASPVSTSINATTLLPAQQQQQPPSRSNSVVSSGFDDDAWTNRPSSTKPVAPTPPLSVPPVPPVPVPERAASVPAVYVAPAPAPSQQQQQPPRAPSAAPAIQQPSASTSSGLARTTESDIFDQLARLSQLRVQSPTATASRSTPVPSPSITSPPPQLPGYNQGLGVNVGPSPVPLGQHLQVQAQQTGLLPPPAPGGPRGPFAPVPANQGLLAPLVPTTTGFPGFLPTRPVAASPSPSFLGPQMTGYQQQQQQQQQQQPTGFQPAPSLLSQPTSFQPIPLSLASQPTGFQPVPSSLAPQPTGFGVGVGIGTPSSSLFGVGGQLGVGGVPPVPPLPSSFQNGSFGQLQPQPTGFNPGFGQQQQLSPFGNGNGIAPHPSLSPLSVPPLPPQSSSATGTTNPANVFAAMKAGTFANDSVPQSADKYDALRVTPSPLSAQPTGWGFPGFPGGYSGYQR